MEENTPNVLFIDRRPQTENPQILGLALWKTRIGSGKTPEAEQGGEGTDEGGRQKDEKGGKAPGLRPGGVAMRRAAELQIENCELKL